LVKIWPVLAGTTVRDSNQWYRQSGKGSQGSRSTAQSVYGKPLPQTPTRPALALGRQDGVSRTVSINERNMSPRIGRPAGIAVEESFVMEHHERSDISLILMKPEREESHSQV
jgi:hypothetical protein